MKTKHKTQKYWLIFGVSLISQVALKLDLKLKGMISPSLVAITALDIQYDALEGKTNNYSLGMGNRTKRAYSICVSISADDSTREMTFNSALTLLTPLTIAILFGVSNLTGDLVHAVQIANSTAIIEARATLERNIFGLA